MTITASPYLMRKFHSCFDQGIRFWTSEDGNPMDWVIARNPDWRKWFDEVFPDDALFDLEATLATKREAWVEQEWSGSDDDGYYESRRGKIWRIRETETPFPVYVFDPKYKSRPKAPDRRGTFDWETMRSDLGPIIK